MIKFEGVEIERHGKTILQELQFDITESIAIFGKMGSGKSTLLDAIAGKIRVTKGEIQRNYVKNIIQVPKDYSFNRVIGAFYQYFQQRYNASDAELGPSLIEVLQNQVKPIGTIDPNSFQLARPKYDQSWISEICTLFRITHLLDRKITSLSNGETRRSLLAISFLQNPDFILLDDPFSGLDVENRILLKNILSNIKSCLVVLICNENDVPHSIKNGLFIENKTARLCRIVQKVPVQKPVVVHNLFFPNDFNYETIIKLKNGKVKYGEKTVLEGIDWEVKKGEKWALIGHNGSGKSSLLTLFTCDNNQSYANDLLMFDIKRGSGESIWDIKKKIGFFSPELHLYFNKQVRVWKAIASGLFDTLGLFKTLSPQQERRVEQVMDKLGLLPLKDTPLIQLSYGQQRMVFLARAIIKSPALLILDEPFQGLDKSQIAFCKEIVNSILADQTLIFVSHYEQEMPEIIDKKLELENGKIKSKI